MVASRTVIDRIAAILAKNITRTKLTLGKVSRDADVREDNLRCLLDRQEPISTAELSRLARVVGWSRSRCFVARNGSCRTPTSSFGRVRGKTSIMTTRARSTGLSTARAH
jgi:hypothetical protein